MSRLRSLRDLDAAALHMYALGEAVLQDDVLPLNQWRKVLFERLPRETVEGAMAKIAGLTSSDHSRPVAELRKSWKQIKRLFSHSLDKINLKAGADMPALQEAVTFLKARKNWSLEAMAKAPLAAIPKVWRPHVLDAKGEHVIDPQTYVLAIFDAWRSALKRRDIYASPGIRYGDPRQGLLSGSDWQAAKVATCRTVGRTLDADTELKVLAKDLTEAYSEAATLLHARDDWQIKAKKKGGKIQIAVDALDRVEDSESLKKLRKMVNARMPKVDLPDLVLEVMRWTGFASAFSHLDGGAPQIEDFEVSLCAVLVSEACNVGFEPMVRPEIPALRRSRLSWVAQNFLRQENLQAASAKIVNMHRHLPIVGHWGQGEVASADGMRFTTPVSVIHAGPNRKYFGAKRGITYYNMLSNQFSGLNAQIIPGTLRDSLHILALRLEQETDLEPNEIMTDTAAYSDVVFGLFWLLGYQFSPRLAVSVAAIPRCGPALAV